MPDRPEPYAPLPGSSLSNWLTYLERLHPSPIELGLSRVAAVRERLGVAPSGLVITVAGTNGKGSTCAFLDSILRAAGYRIGVYTSPHLVRYNERVRLCGVEASDRDLVGAFERVEAARGDVSLTYFEFGTLAAALLFADGNFECCVLEVGLGGRLDAVNLFDADCAVITSIGIDHVQYLGETREAIAEEKAGILRAGRPAVVADPAPPVTLEQHARDIDAQLVLIERDFGFSATASQWTYWSWRTRRAGLPWPALRGSYQLYNAAAALAALDAVHERLPISAGAVRRGLVEAQLSGRFQILPGRPTVVLDVGHNPHAAVQLRETLQQMGRFPRTLAVFAMLKDKDIEGVVRVMAGSFHAWHVAPLQGPRGADLGILRAGMTHAGVEANVVEHESVGAAFEEARRHATLDDRIVVFGSFHTVSAALAAHGRA